MIDLYTWSTPNGRKVSICLEEMGLDYKAHAINIMKDEQFAPDFLKISPNNRIPAIVDNDNGQPVFESGAILIYLAEKTATFMPASGPQRWQTLEWLMWQMGGLGPMLGQTHHFVQFNPDASEYARNRYANEAKRLYGVLDKRLSQVEYVAGDYTIADMSIFPWIARFQWQEVDMSQYPNVVRWFKALAARPAVKRGYNVVGVETEIVIP